MRATWSSIPLKAPLKAPLSTGSVAGLLILQWQLGMGVVSNLSDKCLLHWAVG